MGHLSIEASQLKKQKNQQISKQISINTPAGKSRMLHLLSHCTIAGHISYARTGFFIGTRRETIGSRSQKNL